MSKLSRHIGLLSLTLYGVGDILGSGIYGLIGQAAGRLGNLVWAAFALSFLVALLTALTYAALARHSPKAAGSSWIVWQAFRSPFLAFVVGMMTLASGLTSMAAASRIFAGYLSGISSSLPEPAGIVVFAVILSAITFAGIRESMWANSVATVVELSGLVLIIISGLPYLGEVSFVDTSSLPVGTTLSPSLLLSGAVLTFYSFIGFEDMINVSEEVKEPERTLPVALLLALLIASLVYILVAVVSVSVVPAAELAQSHQPLVDVIGRAWPWFPRQVFGVIALFAVANTALLNFIMGSRLLYGLGNLGLLPKPLGYVHPKRKTPAVAIALVAAMLIALAFAGPVGTLARATSLCILLVFLMMHASFWVLSRRGELTTRLPSAVSWVGALLIVLIFVHAEMREALIAGGLLAGIVVLYLLKKPAQFENWPT